MFKLLVIVISIGISWAYLVDIANICQNIPNGDVIANPYDCKSFLICSTILKIQHCEDGLHFDAKNKFCTWPEFANCTLQNKTEDLLLSVEEDDINGRSLRPKFIAIDPDTGLPTNPMNKYNSSSVECKHYGAYFLPHPTQCRQYYLCAYGHMLQHQCGIGTLWNYIMAECQIAEETECYNRDPEETFTVEENNAELSTVGSVTDEPFWTASSTSLAPYPSTTLKVQNRPSPPRNRPTHTTKQSVNTILTLTCPPDGPAYLPHNYDCSKYFICIAGMPVLTECPQGFYWNTNGEFCDFPINVDCTNK